MGSGALMLAADPLVLDMFRYSRKQVCRVDLFHGTTLDIRGLKVVSGSVGSDRKANVRRTLDCVLALDSWDDLPLDVYHSRAQVWLGVETSPDKVALFPCGVFRINQLSRTRRGEISITGDSLEAYVIDDRFFTPRTPTKNASTLAAIQGLIRESLPDAIFHITATQDKPIHMTAPWDRDRWEAVTILADSIDAEVYNRADGRFVIANKLSFNTAAAKPVWKVTAGQTGVLVSESVNNSRERVYNAVVAHAQNSATNVPPVWAAVVDANPASRTYWHGLYGHVPRFYSNPNFSTKAQCLSAAKNMLSEAIAENRTLDFTMVPNPALEVGDVVAVSIMDGTIENHMIDTLNIPLGLGTWSAGTLISKSTETDA
jgi:hypothetical protein